MLSTPRALFVVLVVVATAAFVVGVAVERSSSDEHVAEPAGEGLEEPHGEEQADDQLLGVDIEAAPFVALAAIGSLLIAAGVWLRPKLAAVLALAVVSMLAFTAFDIRELFHQFDEERTGLAVLAGVIALLHLAASVAAFALRRPVAPSG
jgi:hypothetical protein